MPFGFAVHHVAEIEEIAFLFLALRTNEGPQAVRNAAVYLADVKIPVIQRDFAIPVICGNGLVLVEPALVRKPIRPGEPFREDPFPFERIIVVRRDRRIAALVKIAVLERSFLWTRFRTRFTSAAWRTISSDRCLIPNSVCAKEPTCLCYNIITVICIYIDFK